MPANWLWLKFCVHFFRQFGNEMFIFLFLYRHDKFYFNNSKKSSFNFSLQMDWLDSTINQLNLTLFLVCLFDRPFIRIVGLFLSKMINFLAIFINSRWSPPHTRPHTTRPSPFYLSAVVCFSVARTTTQLGFLYSFFRFLNLRVRLFVVRPMPTAYHALRRFFFNSPATGVHGFLLIRVFLNCCTACFSVNKKCRVRKKIAFLNRIFN